MPERSGRARLITVPEAWNTGCQTWVNKSCPKYMYNYLKEANDYEGIIDGTEGSWGYWTMNARSDYTAIAWIVYCSGEVYHGIVGYTYYGARPVVVINK